MTKKTRKRLIKAFMFARGLFIALFAILLLLGALTANERNNIWTTIIIFASSFACFGIALFCDCLLGGYKSPFYY